MLNQMNHKIILPQYKTTLLTVLQHNGENRVFASFDPDTEYCVVDNCANVHIWNNISAFILESYLRTNVAASTSVSQQ